MDLKPNDWFRTVVGFPENQWDYRMTSIPNGKVRAGTFKAYRLDYLKTILETEGMNMNPATRKLTIRLRGNASREDDFDTSSLQCKGPERGMYQVASNFNCLEVAHERTNPFSGLFLTNLMSDSTQGPSAAGGAAYGAMLRSALNHRLPINLLDESVLGPQVNNGKLYLNMVTPQMIHDLDEDTVKVGLHRDVVANFNRPFGTCQYLKDGPRIDQVYTSTCIQKSRGSHPLAEKLLHAAYEGTYLCAIKRQSTRLVLTLIGGGCFMNSYDQIMNAILAAHDRYADLLPAECDVILPIYDRRMNPYFIGARNMRSYLVVDESI